MPVTLAPSRIRLAASDQLVGTGWLPPMRDRRDYTDQHAEVKPIVTALKKNVERNAPKSLSAPPSSVDLRPWCSPIENQGGLGSCTAHAALGIVEYFQRRSFGKHLDGSRLFVYKTTRNLLRVTGDTGAWLRNTMGALAICGVPNEEYWQYTDVAPDFDLEPPQFVYAVADNFEALKYFAHDPVHNPPPPAAVVASVKGYLAAGVPSMFGFWGFSSFDNGDQPGHIPLPTPQELAGSPAWGHAIVAVGYDDGRKIKNLVSGKTTTGAFLIRNSWGTIWGQVGYGWIPYDYVLKGAAMDFWSMISMKWIDSGQFV